MVLIMQVYECTKLDSLNQCSNWELTSKLEILTQSERVELVTALVSMMIIVFTYRMLRRALI